VQALLILKAIVSFARKHQTAIALALVAALVVSFAWSWHSRGVRLEDARYVAEKAQESAEMWRQVAHRQAEGVRDLREKNDAMERELADALSRPPRTIIEYRDAEPEIVEIIRESPECQDALRDVRRRLQELGHCGGDP